jgi:hypothetical protein
VIFAVNDRAANKTGYIGVIFILSLILTIFMGETKMEITAKRIEQKKLTEMSYNQFFFGGVVGALLVAAIGYAFS